MVKFVLVFALFAMSNKKLKIQYQKHQYFYSFQRGKKKIHPPIGKTPPALDSTENKSYIENH